mmetsp:Transcript_56963/g.135845  ORF Transcript_56963/g.135845 Transcript_56963/m.135845 type:complete len:208 (-) Transcript_56963:107-730(-)
MSSELADSVSAFGLFPLPLPPGRFVGAVSLVLRREGDAGLRLPPSSSSAPSLLVLNRFKNATNSFGKSDSGTSGPGLKRCMASCRLASGSSLSLCRAIRSSLHVWQNSSSSVGKKRPLRSLLARLGDFFGFAVGAWMPSIVCLVVALMSQSSSCCINSYRCFSVFEASTTSNTSSVFTPPKSGSIANRSASATKPPSVMGRSSCLAP